MELIQTLKSNFFITQLQFIKFDIYFVFYNETYNSGMATHMLSWDKCLYIFIFVKTCAVVWGFAIVLLCEVNLEVKNEGNSIIELY